MGLGRRVLGGSGVSEKARLSAVETERVEAAADAGATLTANEETVNSSPSYMISADGRVIAQCIYAKDALESLLDDAHRIYQARIRHNKQHSKKNHKSNPV